MFVNMASSWIISSALSFTSFRAFPVLVSCSNHTDVPEMWNNFATRRFSASPPWLDLCLKHKYHKVRVHYLITKNMASIVLAGLGSVGTLHVPPTGYADSFSLARFCSTDRQFLLCSFCDILCGMLFSSSFKNCLILANVARKLILWMTHHM